MSTEKCRGISLNTLKRKKLKEVKKAKTNLALKKVSASFFKE